ncbi:hypothetical protein SAMN04487948_1018 [Halogranum amylolyticum]|uniref:Winged helix-turn-helix domain n=1 Tax=Halogranum amylolyticum TaxID=660520 RepID=A0A1H8MPK5_9EURY|nr:hypothetical protein [Halogranum amylolyticum]SEO19267.1 hypothetical protein SAMN04487948_1018 [Halogranum amylolyticum]
MYNPTNRSLGPLSGDAYEILLTAIEPSEGIAPEKALGNLREEGFSDGDAEFAIERLLLRGYLYEVDGELFITERAGSSSE